jgi:purine-binding chemotaxis protein CheW
MSVVRSKEYHSGWDRNTDPSKKGEQARFLIFRLGKELFGTPLLEVREVVEAQRSRPIPNTAEYFLGVINLRGQLVNVVDLRSRLGLTPERTRFNALLVVDAKDCLIGGLVDRVDAVIKITQEDIDPTERLFASIPSEYLSGIARLNEQIVPLLNLRKILLETDFVKMSSQSGEGLRVESAQTSYEHD